MYSPQGIAVCSCGWEFEHRNLVDRYNAVVKHLEEQPQTDPVNPSHYRGDYVMRIIEDFKLDFLDGQVIKYILRAGKKDGDNTLEDHKKAAWYLNRKIENMERQ